MDLDALLLSRFQFAVLIAFTIGLAAWLATIEFLFWGAGVFVLPVIAIYTAVVYWMFRGKLRKGYR
jgi:cytochrome bd-type quinol oxidase subunit 2